MTDGDLAAATPSTHDVPPSDASPTDASPAGAPPADRLEALRAELEDEVDQLPVPDRVRRFEHANEVLAAELALLDEV